MHLIAENYQRRVDQGVKDAQARNPELWHLLDKLRTPILSIGHRAGRVAERTEQCPLPHPAGKIAATVNPSPSPADKGRESGFDHFVTPLNFS